MPRLFYGNFDFEESLIRPNGQSRSKAVERILAELATTWVAVAEQDDLIWCPLPVNQGFVDRLQEAGWPRFRLVSRLDEIPPGCEFAPWGWTEEAVAFGERAQAVFDTPPLEAVKDVNSRQFSYELSQSLRKPLSESAVVTTVDELIGTIHHENLGEGHWIIKTEFSQASRDRYIWSNQNSQNFDEMVSWANRQTSRGQRLYVEPFLQCEAEVGVQLEIDRTGDVKLVGLAEMIIGAGSSRYDGSIVSPPADQAVWQKAVTVALDFGRAAAERGYFGPMGIDAMRYRDHDGTIRLQPIQDVNARWTMGRLSLGLRRYVPDNATAYWLHSHGEANTFREQTIADSNRLLIKTSPDDLDGVSVRLRTELVVDRSAGDKDRVTTADG